MDTVEERTMWRAVRSIVTHEERSMQQRTDDKKEGNVHQQRQNTVRKVVEQ